MDTMDTMYEMGIGSGDLKELWDSDMDSANLDLKFASDADIADVWVLERDAKMPQVIFNDKLMTDALLSGGAPIKSEHSYSLKSDGDSMPDSPCSLHDDDKMDDDMDDCYPSVMLASRHHSSNSSHTNNNHHLHHGNSNSGHQPPQSTQHNQSNQPPNPAHHKRASSPATAHPHPVLLITSSASTANKPHNYHAPSPSTSSVAIPTHNSNHHQQHQSTSLAIVNPLSTLRRSGSSQPMRSNSISTHDQSSNSSSDDVDVDDSTVKDEPLSPGSSCPASPTSSYDGDDQLDEDDDGDLLAFASNGEVVFDHKHGSLQMSNPAKRLKGNQSIATSFQQSFSASSSSSAQQPRVAIPKLNIKMEPQHSSAFGLPPTPPSSMSSDDSEGNQSPGHHEVPMSPPSATKSGRRASSVHSNSSSPSSSRGSVGNANNGYIGTSSRQPIHTPLISSQPKGSTGSLLLTEEEKRTLQAEGYPIPTRLPLTKAEEKSLKKIRRKIKNKISAQESRRKKKEYMDQLERKVEILVAERNNYQQAALTYQKRAESLEQASEQATKRVQSLEASNVALSGQLSKYQALIKTLNKMKQ